MSEEAKQLRDFISPMLDRNAAINELFIFRQICDQLGIKGLDD